MCDAKLFQSCLTLCDPMDCNLPGFSVHGILQAKILVWGTISFSRGSSWFRDWLQVSWIVGRFFTVWPIYSSKIDTSLLIIGANEFIHLAIQQTFIDYLPFVDSVGTYWRSWRKINSLFGNTFPQRFSKKLLVLTKRKTFKL